MRVARPAVPRTFLRGARSRLLGWRFFAEVWMELKKSEWPTRQQAARLSVMVIAISVALGAMLGVIDFGFNLLVRLILGA